MYFTCITDLAHIESSSCRISLQHVFSKVIHLLHKVLYLLFSPSGLHTHCVNVLLFPVVMVLYGCYTTTYYLICDFSGVDITLCNSEFYTTMKLGDSGPFFGVDFENHIHFSI